MKRDTEIKNLLIGNAIHLVAEGGFEKATTKELTFCGGTLPDFKMNEVYIYRLFGGKEKLYAAAFARLDNELFGTCKRGIEIFGGFDGNIKEKIKEFFMVVWQFILSDEARCRFYVRYYYSVYFRGTSQKIHKELLEQLAAEMAPLFTSETNGAVVLQNIFASMFYFAIRMYNGELEDDEKTRAYIFRVLSGMIAGYVVGAASEIDSFAAMLKEDTRRRIGIT